MFIWEGRQLVMLWLPLCTIDSRINTSLGRKDFIIVVFNVKVGVWITERRSALCSDKGALRHGHEICHKPSWHRLLRRALQIDASRIRTIIFAEDVISVAG